MSVWFGSCGTAMEAAPFATASSQAVAAKYLFPAAKMRSGHNDVTFTASITMPNIPRLKYKMNYPNVALVSVKDVSWCAVFRSGKILVTLLMVRLVFTPNKWDKTIEIYLVVKLNVSIPPLK